MEGVYLIESVEILKVCMNRSDARCFIEAYRANLAHLSGATTMKRKLQLVLIAIAMSAPVLASAQTSARGLTREQVRPGNGRLRGSRI